MIRFQRIGRTNDSAFRIAVLEKERAAQAGNIVELLGTYNPRSKALTLNEESVKSWLAKGAQPTDSIKNLLITKGVISGKKVNVLPKSLLEKKPEVVEALAAAPVAATPAAAEEVAAPTEAEVEAEAIPAETPVAEAAEEVPTAETPAA
ncbi:MAG: 30S ribosomal protein S16 [Minisyncoccia bacterium]